MAYTTVGAVKEYLGISEATDDELIATLIASAQQAIDNYCHRTFEASADSTRYFDFSRSNIDGLTLILYDEIAAITTVTNGDGIEVASDEYTTIPRNETPYFRIRLLSNSGKVWTYTTEWMDAISVIGKWAYSTEAPDDIVQACIELVSFVFRKKDAPLADVTAIEAGTVIKTKGFAQKMTELILPARVRP